MPKSSGLSVFFTASARRFVEFEGVYSAITNTILRYGGTLSWRFVDTVRDRIRHNNYTVTKQEWREIFDRMYKALLASDVAIFENTVSAFSTGFLAGLSIANRIPTLVLIKQGIPHTFKTSFIEGITSEHLFVRYYRYSADLHKYIRNFIDLYSEETPTFDFHLRLSNKERTFIRRMARMLGTTQIGVVRRLIAERMLEEHPRE